MVLEYLPTFAPTKSPCYVVKYTSTMVRIWVLELNRIESYRIRGVDHLSVQPVSEAALSPERGYPLGWPMMALEIRRERKWV